jgi:hypothetical protein
VGEDGLCRPNPVGRIDEVRVVFHDLGDVPVGVMTPSGESFVSFDKCRFTSGPFR